MRASAPGRYRKVQVWTWLDDTFNKLSAPPPSGRYLWLYLLTNPDTVNLPGLYRCGEAAMAEALGWPLKGFREAFAEVEGAGLVKADWSARVVWLPNALRYNAPESPNVVLSWRMPWFEIPNCALKDEAYQEIRDFLEGMGEPFLKAFEKACDKPTGKPSGNQEQEQEQEQERLFPEGAPPRVAPVTTKHLSIEAFIATLKLNPAYKGINIDAELSKMDAWLLTKPGRQKTRSFIVNWLNKIDRPVGSTMRPGEGRGFIRR